MWGGAQVGRQQHTAWLCSYDPCRSISHTFNCGVHVTWQLLSGCIWLSTALLLQQLHHYNHMPEFVCVRLPCRDWVAGVDFHPSGTSLASGSGQTHFQCSSCIDNVHCLGVPTPMQQHRSACIVGAGSREQAGQSAADTLLHCQSTSCDPYCRACCSSWQLQFVWVRPSYEAGGVDSDTNTATLGLRPNSCV